MLCDLNVERTVWGKSEKKGSLDNHRENLRKDGI